MNKSTNIRLRFSKSGPLRFIGHLDLVRTFRQTIRRATLPMAYSQGFNPHMRLSFALPLPLGMESVNDYADIVLENEMPFDEIINQLNNHAPKGLRFSLATEAAGNAAALAAVADYRLQNQTTTETIQEILNKSEFFILKKTKSGTKETDIRPDIFDIWPEGSHIIMRLAAGSMRFLNPLTVANLLNPAATVTNLTRLELYSKELNPL